MSAPNCTPRRLFLIALIPAVLLGARLAKSEVVLLATPDGDSWEMVIEPARAPADGHSTAPLPEGPLPVIEPVLPSPVRHGQAGLDVPQQIELPLPVALQQEEDQQPVPPPADPEEADIEIVPNESSSAAEEGARRYRNIYEAIPFSRTEYLANPSYRHEATMEILFGQLRPMTIHKTQHPRVHHERAPLSALPYAHGGGYFPAAFDYWRYRAPAFRYFLPFGTHPELLDY